MIKNVLLNFYEALPLDKLYDALGKIQTRLPSDGEAKLEVNPRNNGRTLYVIHSNHWSREGMRLLHEQIRPNASQNPQNWLFLIEGNLTPDAYDRPELIYGYNLAKKLNIPTEDPIICPYNKDTINLAFQRGMKPKDVYSALILEMHRVNPDLDSVVQGLSKEWNISPEYLRDVLRDLMLKIVFKEKEEIKKTLKKTWEKLIQISNELSGEKLEGIIERYKDKSKILAYLGTAHKDILEKI